VKRLPLVIAAAIGAVGCAASVKPAALRPIGEDLVALLPSGADAVLDVDVTQLSNWATARRLLALLPEAGKRELHRFGEDPLASIDALAVAVSGVATPDSEATVLLRGSFDLEQLRGGLGGTTETVEYHDMTVIESADAAIARLTPNVVALGSRVQVRRVIDVARRQDEGLRTAAVDRPLQTALAHAPTAKLGRPAVLAALIPTAALRERLRTEGWQSVADLDWLALSFAVGDGFEVFAVGGAHGAAEAKALAQSAKARAAELAEQVTVRLLGLTPFIRPFVVATKEEEVHVGYGLPERRLDELVTRLEQMQALGQRKAEQP
jgi:hypothetical protein